MPEIFSYIKLSASNAAHTTHAHAYKRHALCSRQPSIFTYNEEGCIYASVIRVHSSNTIGRLIFAGGGHRYTQSVASVSTQSLLCFRWV